MAPTLNKMRPTNVVIISQIMSRVHDQNARRAEKAAAAEPKKLADELTANQLTDAKKLRNWVIFLSRVADTNVLLLILFLWRYKDSCSPKTKTILFGITGAVKLLSMFGLAYAKSNPLLANDEDLRNELPERIVPRRRLR